MYFLATSLALCGIILFSEWMGRVSVSHGWTKPHFLFLFIVVSFFQEFAFRGFLMPLLKKIFSDGVTIVLLNALLFAVMHVIYPFPVIGLPLAFLGGIFFAALYHKYPNLILVTIAHSVLNFAMVWYGFFTV
jgi:membrane protease YdiL (CAAX protease family)